MVSAGVGALLVLMVQGVGAKRTRKAKISARARFEQTIAQLSQHYVEPVDGEEFWEAMSRCATEDLDPYSYYLGAETKRRLAGASRFGLALARRPGHGPSAPLRVVALDPTGPARAAGLSLGMPIDAVNHRPAPLLVKQSEIELALRVPEARELHLRSGERSFKVAALGSQSRERPLLETRTFECEGQRGLYVQLAGFERGVAQALRARIERPGKALRARVVSENEHGKALRAENVSESEHEKDLRGGGKALRAGERAKESDFARGLVLDLRGNPGGEIQQAFAIADMFLSSGLITRIRGRRGQVQREVRASVEETLPASLSLVILIDGYTASAAELLTAALQDHGRALVVGDPSFGKGSIQTVQRFEDGALLRYTTGRYFSPLDHAIDQRGVRPDLHWHSARRNKAYSNRQLCWLSGRWAARNPASK